MAGDPELAAATESAEQLAARFDEILIRYGLPSLDDEEEMAGPEELRRRLDSVDTLALIGDQAVELVRVEGRWFANLDMEGQLTAIASTRG